MGCTYSKSKATREKDLLKPSFLSETAIQEPDVWIQIDFLYLPEQYMKK